MLERLIDAISKQPLTLSTEAALQAQLEKIFKEKEIPYQREFVLDTKNRIDFLCGDVGIEIKVYQPIKSIFKQCERYAKFDQIGSLILVTGRTMGFPSEINGKSCYLVSLGKAWL